jgi:ArsR family transcriptional regulator
MDTTAYFKALGDETRLRILNLLRLNELHVNEIVAILGMGQSRISRHLKILSEVSLITSRKDGLWVFYRASGDGFQGRLTGLLGERFKSEDIFAVDISRMNEYIKKRSARGNEYFNLVASDWQRIRREILGGLDLNAEILTAVKRCGCAADLGCGNGELAAELLAKAGKVIGVDRSTGMLEEAARYLEKFGRGRFDFRLGEMSHLPIRDMETDCTVINMVLHYLDEPVAAFSEASRITGNGGRLIVAELESHENESMRKVYGHRWLGFSRDEVSRWIMGNGFVLRKMKILKAAKGLNVILYVAEKVEDRYVEKKSGG